ncbi:MAG TPA: energy transducer TonB [Vicinamibacterales bacterium]|nr:energy transducer TonB [Vicinamibacterales bacterium]
MPGTMFTEVVSSRANSSRKWYTIPLSLIAHALVFAVIIVIPLVATDKLPKLPQSMLSYTPVAAPPAPTPAVPRTQSQAPSKTVNTFVAPVDAPPTIENETGVVPDYTAVQTAPIDRLFDGLGEPGIPIEQPPPPVVSATPVRVHPGGQIKVPTRIKNVVPTYPRIARENKVQGMVMIQATIGVDGRVENAEVLRSIPLLDQAALEAVRAWEYTPTLLNGTPTPVIMTVTVQFTLN